MIFRRVILYWHRVNQFDSWFFHDDERQAKEQLEPFLKSLIYANSEGPDQLRIRAV